MILTPTPSADQFIQAIGRGSRRNSQGPTDVHLLANDSRADRRRLSQLVKGLQFIAATGSPAIAPFLQLATVCLDKASLLRTAQDQSLIQQPKNQQPRSARIFDPSRCRTPQSQSGVRL
jgi:superfamily II DNA or RNA helicase